MKNSMNLFLQETLDKNRLDLLEKFKEIKKMWFYLAGWTALALQFWHRKSIDFDFFINNNFIEQELFEKMLKIFEWQEIKKTFSEKNTLYIEVNQVKISFFGYKYKLIDNLIKTDFFDLASYKDIGAMKLWAIQKRATNKDYIDLYYIFQKLDLETLINCFFLKFWKIITTQIILKSLVYFDDIIEEKLFLSDEKLSFNMVKEFFINCIKKYESDVS
jgi:hypothetical protein